MTRITTEVDQHRSAVDLINYLADEPNLVKEAVGLTSGSSAVSVDTAVYKTEITTGGTAGSEDVNIGDGTGAVIGERHLIELTTRTNASDVVNLDHLNVHNAAGTALTNLDMDAEGEFVLVEWTGSEWQIIYSDATESTM